VILAIIGAGRIGLAVKKLLKDDFEIKICDTRVAAETAGISGIDWIDASDTKMLSQYLDYSDVVLSAVNYKLNKDILQLALKKKKHYELMEIILDESGYSKMLKDKKDLESEGRLENLKELIRGMNDFDNLQGFLEHVALATSIDQDWDGQKVNLMTMHASKGLEFDAVFLPGWEEGLFPHQKSLEEKGDLALEEERRLAYVGLTRAKKESFISFVMSRMYRGDWVDSLASRFIDELPEENIKKEEAKEQNNEDFFFNQDIDYNEGIKSPGWARLQKRKLIK